jgi:hypothetical protein
MLLVDLSDKGEVLLVEGRRIKPTDYIQGTAFLSRLFLTHRDKMVVQKLADNLKTE